MYEACRENIKFCIENEEYRDKSKKVMFKSPILSNIEEVDRAVAYLYEAKDPIGAVILIHGTGNKNFNPLRYYARKLRDNGYTVLMPVLPYHFERTPKNKKSGTAFIKGTDVELEGRFEQAVCDIFACTDYLSKLGFKKINIMGVSFGGMVSTIAMALDKRIQKGIFIVTGGNFEHITWNSICTKVLRMNYEENDRCNAQRCKEIHKCFDSACTSFKEKDQLSTMPCCFRYDPSIFANIIDPKKVIMFSAAFDIFVPRKSSIHLWKKLREPKRYILLAGHLGSHLIYRRYIFRESLKFLSKIE